MEIETILLTEKQIFLSSIRFGSIDPDFSIQSCWRSLDVDVNDGYLSENHVGFVSRQIEIKDTKLQYC